MNEIHIERQAHWTYYHRIDLPQTPAEFQYDRQRGEVTGKYLFFCPHRDWLIELVKDEIAMNGFAVGKINNIKEGEDWVLCLYWKDDSRKWELATKYPNSERCALKYRFWKSDADTVAGKYSPQHLAAQAKNKVSCGSMGAARSKNKCRDYSEGMDIDELADWGFSADMFH